LLSIRFFYALKPDKQKRFHEVHELTEQIMANEIDFFEVGSKQNSSDFVF